MLRIISVLTAKHADVGDCKAAGAAAALARVPARGAGAHPCPKGEMK